MEKSLDTSIAPSIYSIRGMQVMRDRDLAILYGITTKALNQAYKRNKERFPETFAFTLSENELYTLRSQIVTLEKKNVGKGTHSKYLPTVYTEYGVAMLSAVLKTEKAVAISIEIIDFFVRVRRMIRSGELMIHRIDLIEKRLIGYDLKFDEIDQFIQKTKLPQHGIFFDNQIFDAYTFFSELLQHANQSIVLIDNYIDHTVLLQLSKRPLGVSATIYTERIAETLQLDLAKHNAQYPPIAIRTIQKVHDRFLLMDEKELYHIGASIKDLGKRWFAFSRMDSLAGEMMARLSAND